MRFMSTRSLDCIEEIALAGILVVAYVVFLLIMYIYNLEFRIEYLTYILIFI